MHLLKIAIITTAWALFQTSEDILKLLYENEIGISEKLRSTIDKKQEFGILTPDLMNEKSFAALGLDGMSINCHKFNVPFTQNQSISIPHNSGTLFIFNATSEAPIQSREFSNFIANSPPFKLPQNIELVDYFMIIPKRMLESAKLTMNHSMIYSNSDLFPLFKQKIADENPTVIFMYDESTKVEVEDTPNPFASIFFDDFAVNWMKSSTYEKLVHSVFCTINTLRKSFSYCIRISPTHSVKLFPAYEPDSKVSAITEEGFMFSHNDEYNVPLAGLPLVDRPRTTLESLRVKIPRTNYSQILYYKPEYHISHNLVKRDSIISNATDCRKITWYNVFHYSIFGNIKFCTDDKK